MIKKEDIKNSKYVKYGFIVAVIGIISLLFPKSGVENANIAIGELWNQSDLIANRSFVVRKTDNQLESERGDIENSIIPIFSRNQEIADQSLQDFKVSLLDFYNKIGEAEGKKTSRVAAYVSELSNHYSKGIFNTGDYIGNNLRIGLGNDLKTVAISDLLTEEKAEEELRLWMDTKYKSYYSRSLELLKQHTKPNFLLDSKRTQEALVAAVKKIDPNSHSISKGEVIVANGDRIDVQKHQNIVAFRKDSEKSLFAGGINLVHFLGYFLLTCLIIGAFLMYLHLHFEDIFQNFNKLSFLLMWPVIFSVLVYIVEQNQGLTSYLIPFCIVPIVVKNFFSERLALFLHIVIVLIASFLSKLGYEFTFLEILVGIVTVLFVSETRYWSKFFRAILIIFCTYILAYLGLALINNDAISNISWGPFLALSLASILTLLAYPFIPLLERLFGFTSSISLVELADMNRPLLKKMSITAPGTLQHSLQVSNLSEAAAERIGANSLLIKVAALYHDIGKLEEPEYFIENQSSGPNPHNAINNFESAKKIINHVISGEKMAIKAKLPQIIIDFIVTHHGDTRVEYFYRNQLKDEPNREFDESLFRYPGPKPKTKEQTILMIADSLEAASKSLKNPTGKDIDDLVAKIIAGKIQHGQFEESELSFWELEKCEEVFKSLLRSINHVRVEYPEEVQKKLLAKKEF